MDVVPTVRDLRWLLTTADLGHVTDAASALRTTQPTLSRALARLEDELGTRLFERTPTGVVATPSGLLAVDAARDLVERYDRLVGAIATEQSPDRGTVRLAFLDSMATSLVPRVLRAFHEQAPGVRLVLTQEPGHRMAADFDAAAIDLAITSARPDSTSGSTYGWHVLQREQLVVVVSLRHRFASRRRLTLAEIADDELVITPEGYGYRTLVETLFRNAGLTPRVAFESQDLGTIEGLVGAGLGIAVLPEPFSGHSGTVGVRLHAADARRTIGLAWRADRPLSPPAARLRDLVVGRDWS